MSTPLKNRDEVKALINALTAIHSGTAYKDTLAEQIADNLVFRKKVTATDTGTGAKTIDFDTIDYLELTATGNITISFTNINVGEVKLLKVIKSGGVTIAFSGAADQTPIASAVSALTYVYYSVYRQDTSGTIIAEPISKVILQATEAIAGIAEIATNAEVAAGSSDTKIVTPAKLGSTIGWATASNVYSNLRSGTSVRCCKVGKVVYVNGEMGYTSEPSEGTTIFTLPSFFPLFTETVKFPAGDGDVDEGYELRAEAGTRNIVNGPGGSTGSNAYFAVSIPIL